MRRIVTCVILRRHKPTPGRTGLAAFVCAYCGHTVLQSDPSLIVALRKADLAVKAGDHDLAQRIKEDALREIGQEP